jgi:excisionase family DNA binding protein
VSKRQIVKKCTNITLGSGNREICVIVGTQRSGAAMNLMKVNDVAGQLNCSASLVYEHIAAGRLACYRIGKGHGGVRISEEQLAAFLTRAVQREDAPKGISVPEKMRSTGFTILDGDRLREAWEHRR